MHDAQLKHAKASLSPYSTKRCAARHSPFRGMGDQAAVVMRTPFETLPPLPDGSR